MVGNEQGNITPEQFQDLIPVFQRMPDSFWYSWTTLYAHYLGSGIGEAKAAHQAMNAIVLGLPIVKTLIGNFNAGNVNVGNTLNRTGAAA